MPGAAADLDQVLLQRCRNVCAAEVCTNYASLKYVLTSTNNSSNNDNKEWEKPTAPGVPRRSPIQVLSWPDDA